jgi:hypothetical protein
VITLHPQHGAQIRMKKIWLCFQSGSEFAHILCVV